MTNRSISAINKLPADEKFNIYRRFIPQILFDKYLIPHDLIDDQGRNLLTLICVAGSGDVILDLRHEYDAPDPLLFAHLTDTVFDQIHVLLYVVNDPNSPRFDIDRMPDGTPTQFGIFHRNIPAEVSAMEAGLAPGQVRRGIHSLRHSIQAFESFITSLEHKLYFVDPLAYHNAIVFERYGFTYQEGRSLMERIHQGFQPDGELALGLDGSTPFRQPWMQASIRGRSWAIHDGILGEPYTNVTMYKRIGENAQVNTFPGGKW